VKKINMSRNRNIIIKERERKKEKIEMNVYWLALTNKEDKGNSTFAWVSFKTFCSG
jgi:outer membrane lipoprotein-sorting protein